MYSLLGLLKNKVIILQIDNDLIQWLVDLFSFAISFVIPLLVGVQSDLISDTRLEINKAKEKLDLSNYDTFKHLYEELKKKTNSFKRFSHSLAIDYLFLRFYMPIMEFFHLEAEGEFYSKPELVEIKTKEIISVLNELEFKIREENLSGSKICQREDRTEIIEKVITICSFYNYYYTINLDELIIKIIKENNNRLSFADHSLRLSCALALNKFKFDENLYNSKLLFESDKYELALFEKIKIDSIKLAQTVNSINDNFNETEIVFLYLNFFELKNNISGKNNLLSLIFNTELLAFYDYLKTSFSNANLTDQLKKNLFQTLKIRSTQYFSEIDNLGDFILTLFKIKYAIGLEEYLNIVFSMELNKESTCSYHPIYDLYFALNSKVSTGINYLPHFKELNNNIYNIKSNYVKDIHVWLISKMNSLIRRNQIVEAERIYSEINFDVIHNELDSNAIYKYSMLLCKSVFTNRLYDNYKESIIILKKVYDQTSLLSDHRDSKRLIFTFAFENRDKPTYRYVYDQLNKQEKEEYIKIAHRIRIFGKEKYLYLSKWLYVSYPVLNGYLLKDCRAPKVITENVI